MEDNTDLSNKRNLSEVSVNSSSSPIQLPSKISRMSSDDNSISFDEKDLSLKEFVMALDKKVDHLPDQLSSVNPDNTSNSCEDNDLSLKDSVKALGVKVDQILSILQRQSVETKLDVKSLRDENCSLHLRLQESDGLISRLNDKVIYLETNLENLQLHSMKANILFHNLPESQNENCIQELYRFMKIHLKIEEDAIFSRQNPGGDICLDVAHRIGKKLPNQDPLLQNLLLSVVGTWY